MDPFKYVRCKKLVTTPILTDFLQRTYFKNTVVSCALGLALSVFKISARNSVHHKRKPSLLFSSSPHHTANHLHKCAQPFTFFDELELQKHLNTCLRNVITRTLEHFLNIFDMFCRVFSSSPLSIFLSAPIAKRCASHVIITFGRKLHQHPVVSICKILSYKVQETSRVISKCGEFNKTMIPFALIGYDWLYNTRLFTFSYPTRAHAIIVKYLITPFQFP